MTKQKVKKPTEGDIYSFQLDDGRFALNVLARVETTRPRKPYVIFIYTFGPYFNESGMKSFLPTLTANDAVCRLKTSALGIYKKDWQFAGSIPDWKRNDWIFPDFYFQDDFTKRAFRRRLSEHDLITCIEQTPIKEIGNLERDSLHGSESARRTASKLMVGLPSLDIVLN